MHIFEYSSVTESIPSDIVETIMAIESKRALDELRVKAYSKELEKTIDNWLEDNAYSSCILEGSEKDDEVDAYASCLRKMLKEMDDLEGDQYSILQIHRTLFYDTTRKESRFRIRDMPVDVRHTSAIHPPSAREVGPSMEQMLESFNVALDVGVKPILLVPCMILDYLNIFPFQEGNWRTSRLMTQLFLMKNGFEALRYVPLDGHIGASTEDYYDSISESSDGWRNNDSDPFPFIRFVCEMVLECYEEFESRYPLSNGKKLKKGERIEHLLSESDSPLSKAHICAALPDISIRTADVVLSELISEGKVKKIGSYRDARYEHM